MTNSQKIITARSLPEMRLDSAFVRFRTLACVTALCLMPQMVYAAPVFSAGMYTNKLGAGLGWSSDLGPQVVSETGGFLASGAPVTVVAQAIRDGRAISATITQTAPYVLDDQYWAGSWTGSMSIPRPGLYGLSASVDSSSFWNFNIAGLTPSQVTNTTFYYAALWDIDAPSDIHPSFDAHGVHPVVPLSHGTATGSFTLGGYYSVGAQGFPTIPAFNAGTYSFDSNSPGLMDFSYRIAFSTTPIDADVFASAAVPEPGTIFLLGPCLAGWYIYQRRLFRAPHAAERQS
ncbi:MAG: hypothetical protein EXQ52_12525 [Bryobacterales bacterium]|nr:hypothetical protein [Bryobacterales bacterium]